MDGLIEVGGIVLALVVAFLIFPWIAPALAWIIDHTLVRYVEWVWRRRSLS